MTDASQETAAGVQESAMGVTAVTATTTTTRAPASASDYVNESTESAEIGERYLDSAKLSADDRPVLDPDTFLNEQSFETGMGTMTAEAAGAAVKWNPGHYVTYGSTAGDFMIDAGLEETKNMPFVKGIMIRVNWNQIEKGKGDYDFSRIDRYLSKAQNKNKRLFILLGHKSFSGADPAVPKYLHTAEYGGGVYKLKTVKGSTGENAALWNDKVRDRFIALLQALGRRYNGHSHFEGVALNETALGDATKPMSDAQENGYFSNLAKIDSAMRYAFPNTVTIQFINYPRRFMPALYANLADKGVGMGGPDIFTNDSDMNKYVYPYNDKAQGQVPIGMKVEPDSYYTTHHGGAFNPPDVRELYRLGQNRLHSNYMFWVRDLSKPHEPWWDVLRMFKGEAFPDAGAGGLASQCPRKFPGCSTGR